MTALAQFLAIAESEGITALKDVPGPLTALDDLTALLVRLHPEDSTHEPAISHLVGKLRAAIEKGGNNG